MRAVDPSTAVGRAEIVIASFASLIAGESCPRLASRAVVSSWGPTGVHMMRRLVLALGILCLPGLVSAQPVGTFRWQSLPYCNVITLAVTRVDTTFRLEGFDDQCGAATQASAIGTAFFNADGSVGIGLNIVQSPGGAPAHIDAKISTGSFSGTWRDNAGNNGNFIFTPGASAGGSPRPLYNRVGFIHIVSAASQSGECTQLDHPLLNGQPGAIVVATHMYLTGPGYLNKHYSTFFSGMSSRWFICTPGGAPPAIGHRFNVIVFKQ